MGKCNSDCAAETGADWFSKSISNCLAHARRCNEAGDPIVGIMCEYTPREVIMAAGAVPVCLCGGSGATIPSAEEDLPANICPLIKSTYGYHLQKSNPFLEMADLIVAETTCDGKKKMFELMGLSRDMHILELAQRSNDPEALTHWVGEIAKLKKALEKRYQVEITDDKLRAAIRTMNRERSLRRQLAEAMKAEEPAMTGLRLLELKSSISGVCADLAQYENELQKLKTMEPIRGAKEKVRVLMTGVPMPLGAERVLEIVEDNGGLVVCMENCTGLKPILEDVDENAEDPMQALAEKYYHLPCSVMTPNQERLDSIRLLAKEYNCQCVVELVWQACLTYDVESHFIKRLAEKDLGLPYLRIETDYSSSDSARIAVRVEALFETVRGFG